MKLLEIKNNLIKISYSDDDKIGLAKFIALVDNNKSYVGQIVNLKADIRTNYAIAKLIFTFNDEGIVENYDGTAPSIKAQLKQLDSADILNLLPIEKPIFFGELAQQNVMLKTDQTIFEKNLIICAEKFDDISTIVKNSSTQLAESGEKIAIIDINHTFGEFEPVRFKRDFKLPLNSKMIDYIYENDLTGVDASSKAVIQDIFYEVQQYTKSVEGNFIPFDNFLKVVSKQYEQSNIPELLLLKHKLLKYQEENIFAQTKAELDGLINAIAENQISYIDIADIPDSLQKELISYIYTTINSANSYIYLFVKLTNKNADKKLLMQIFDSENIFTTIICSHNYKYLPELKQIAENLIFFAPQTLQHDFASYNTLLNKLNANEFVIYGALTQNVPFIVELSEFSQDTSENEQFDNTKPTLMPEPTELKSENVEKQQENISEPELNVTDEQENTQSDNVDSQAEFDAESKPDIEEKTYTKENSEDNKIEPKANEKLLTHDELVNQVAKDVDEILYTQPQEIPNIEDITSQDTITEDDLDFIDDLSVEEPMEEEIDLNDNFEATNEFSAKDETSFEEIPEIMQEDTPEVISEQDETVIMDEEPVLDDIPTEYEIDNTFGEPDTEDELLEEPQPPVVPIYPSEEPVLDSGSSTFEQGDVVTHPKYGKGVIEKLIKYGNKTLCSISFENVGRRLLDPAISELRKVD